MRSRKMIGAVVLTTAAGAAVALTLPAVAGEQDRKQPVGASSVYEQAVDPAKAAEALLPSLQRDLKRTRAEALRRLSTEVHAAGTDDRFRAAAGSRYAGAWIDKATGRLTVGVTDAAAAKRVRTAGAQPKVVARSAAQLSGAQVALDRAARAAPAGLTAWYVAPAKNSVMLLAAEGGTKAALAFARRAGVRDGVQVLEAPPLRTVADVRGGDKYIINGSARCSVGFSVTTGFVSAGHCGSKGAKTTGFDGSAQGTFRTSQFGNAGGNDYSVIDTNANWTPKPVVNTTNGPVTITGSKVAQVGAGVCRTGSTTGTHCGTITGRDVSVNVSGRLAKGFIMSDVCAEPGDSGGSLVAGGEAQGITSGSSGNCKGGKALTVYQPINPVLTAEGLTLVTAAGGQPAPTPTATPSQSPSAKPSPSGTSAPATTPPATTPPATVPTTAPTAGSTEAKFAAEVVGIVNQERRKAGCAADLTVDARLTTAAVAHSQDMAAKGYFSHDSADGRSPFKRITDAGYDWQMAGENIAFGQKTPTEVMTAWMNSSGHRANILRCEFKNIGVGVAFRGNSPFWTQDFGTLR